jgi:hypothetical protein
MSNNTKLPAIFSELLQHIQASESEGYAKHASTLQHSYQTCKAGMDRDSSLFLGTLMLHAYMGLKGGSMNNENIYLRNYEVSQIRLFDILIDKLPYVKYSQAMVNKQIVQMLSECREATLLDIGIGLGTQVKHILSSCQNLEELEKLTIVGIEPGSEALAAAEKSILEMQAQLPFTIVFKGYEGFAEKMDLSSIMQGCEYVIVNASLALHHIQSDEDRTGVLAQIKALNPVALFLIEPNVNHFEKMLVQRFIHCFRHFYALFCTIDNLDISEQEKNGLKLFFGREIEDIIGKQEDERFEKHEAASQWIDRLNKVGFFVNAENLELPQAQTAGVHIAHQAGGYVGFTFKNETVLAIIQAA